MPLSAKIRLNVMKHFILHHAPGFFNRKCNDSQEIHILRLQTVKGRPVRHAAGHNSLRCRAQTRIFASYKILLSRAVRAGFSIETPR